MLHNETVNVWSHCLPFGAFVALMAVTVLTMFPHPPLPNPNQFTSQDITTTQVYLPVSDIPMEQSHSVSQWPILFFLLTSAACLAFSVIFHLFYPMSQGTLSLTQESTKWSAVWTSQASHCFQLAQFSRPYTTASTVNSPSLLSISRRVASSQPSDLSVCFQNGSTVPSTATLKG